MDDGLTIPADVTGTGTAIVAKRGDVVFVECTRDLSHEQMMQIGQMLKTACETYGVQVVVLPPFLKVARATIGTDLARTEPDAGGSGDNTKETT